MNAIRVFARMAIQRKLVTLVMLSTSAALILACSAFVAYELSNYRESAARELRAMAQMIAGTSTAALAFGDHKAASETLNALANEPRVLAACIYASDGTKFGTYMRNPQGDALPNRPQPDGPYFEGGRLLLFHAVMLDGERVGTIFLLGDLTDMYQRLLRYAIIVVVVLSASQLAAFLVSFALQRFISAPILELAETASSVSRDGNYSIRAKKREDDEIGVLVDRFNEMMDQIHSRDEALLAARDKLEDRVAERTRQLQVEISERKAIEKDLIAAKDAAEASNRAKSVFLANMSHELRTPLNAIIGYSEMLQEDAEALGQDTFTSDLRKIHGAGKHLLSLISDVLDLSKIEAGRMEVHPENFVIGDLLDEVMSTAGPLAKRNNNRLVAECSLRDVEMRADRIKFRQSLFNLVGNACKFTENGVITVRVEKTQREGVDWIEWSVSDTGIGLAPDQMDRLFRAFSQVDSSATRRHGGTGLGLAISQKLCEMMGGKIVVESTIGAGSTFTARLPWVAVADVAAPGLAEPVPEVVLVVDRDLSVRETLERTLGSRGYQVVATTDADEALRLAHELRPAAVIVDILLPARAGWTLYNAIRSDATFKGVPVLLHAAAAEEAGAGSSERLVAVIGKRTSGASANQNPRLSELIAGECPVLFEPGAACLAMARLTETGAGQTAFDLRFIDNGGRQFANELSRNGGEMHLSVLGLDEGERMNAALGSLAGAFAAIQNRPAGASRPGVDVAAPLGGRGN